RKSQENLHDAHIAFPPLLDHAKDECCSSVVLPFVTSASGDRHEHVNVLDEARERERALAVPPQPLAPEVLGLMDEHRTVLTSTSTSEVAIRRPSITMFTDSYLSSPVPCAR